MEISHIYDTLVAHRFDQDPFNIYGDSRETALSQVLDHVPEAPGPILDIGMGTGNLLLNLHGHFPTSELFGLEISEKMAAVAEGKFSEAGVPVHIFRAGAEALPQLIPTVSLGLVTMHYILNYVDSARTLADVGRALKPGGFLSLASCTRECFPVLHGFARNFVSADFIQDQLFIPENFEKFSQMLQESGFEVVQKKEFRKELVFENYDHLKDFAFHSGWLAHPFFSKITPEQEETYREFSKAIFPFSEWFISGVALARKL